MKKTTLILSFLFLGLVACEKEDPSHEVDTNNGTTSTSTGNGNECTTCTESHTGVQSDFCGTASEVSNFQSELISLGAQAGQSWSCN